MAFIEKMTSELVRKDEDNQEEIKWFLIFTLL